VWGPVQGNVRKGEDFVITIVGTVMIKPVEVIQEF